VWLPTTSYKAVFPQENPSVRVSSLSDSIGWATGLRVRSLSDIAVKRRGLPAAITTSSPD